MRPDESGEQPKRLNLRRLFLYLLIGSVSLSALVGIVVVILGNFGMIEVRVLFTTLTVTVTSVFGLACGAYLESGRGRRLPIAGIAFSVLSALMCFLIIWDVLDDSEIFIKSFLTCVLLAAGCAHLSLLFLARLDGRFSWTRTAAVLCVMFLLALVLYIIWFEPKGESDMIYRILGVLGILLASITVVTPVLHKLSSQDTDVEALDKEIESVRQKLAELEARRAAM